MTWSETQLKKWADPEVDWDEKELMVVVFNLGIVSLAEDTTRWALAWQLYWLYKTKRVWPTYHSIYYDWVLGLKSSYKATKPEPQAFGLLTYPDNREKLPPHIYNRVYGDGDKPVHSVIPGFSCYGKTSTFEENLCSALD